MGYICYDVRCPNCAEAFYETTEFYDPNKMTTGEMLRFKKKYGPEGYNWSLPFSDHDMSEGIVCVECGGPLAPSGKVQVVPLSLAEGIAQSAEGQENPQAEFSGIPVLNATEGEEEQPSILSDHTESTQEKLADDSIPNYLKQENCPECGKFFNAGDPWQQHLATHTPEVRAQILKKIEPVVDNQPTVPAKPLDNAQIGGPLPDLSKGTKKAKGPKGQAKLQADLIPETDESDGIHCPMCEARFDKDKQGDYEAHFKTHDLGNVQQTVQG